MQVCRVCQNCLKDSQKSLDFKKLVKTDKIDTMTTTLMTTLTQTPLTKPLMTTLTQTSRSDLIVTSLRVNDDGLLIV